MIVFAAIQMSAPKRKSPQSVTIKLQIEGINAFELSFTFIYSKERVYELTECQKDIILVPTLQTNYRYFKKD